MSRPWRRWLPAAAVPAVVAAGALTGAVQSGAGDDPPARSAEQVVALMASHSVSALSGTLEQNSDLGLPQLSGIGPSAGSSAPSTGPASAAAVSSALELLTGTHTIRVYLDGPTNARLQVLDPLAERDVVRHGNDVWLYTSRGRAATHLTLPSGSAAKDSRDAAPTAPAAMPTPDALARRLLAAAGPSTDITLGPATTVAGRSAYDLVLTPRSSDTLIGSVAVAVDAGTGLPLSVNVSARGQDAPAFQLAFTFLTLGAPPADRFTFTPPPGATVRQETLPDRAVPGHVQPRNGQSAHGSSGQVQPGHAQPEHMPKESTPVKPGSPGAAGADSSASGVARHPMVTGTGWDAVAEIPASALPPELADSPLLGQVMRPVAGGRLLSTALVNVLFTTDGRVFAGSVPLERLQAAAATG